MVTELLRIARAYVAAGLSVAPIRPDGTKAPSVDWKPYQERLPTSAELVRWFGREGAAGVAILGGQVSGGLEVLDLDSDDLHAPWSALVGAHDGELLARLPAVKTPRGLHYYYRCPGAVEGNRKLAERPPTAEELAASPRCRSVTLIETRGEGGYVLAPGCPPACHPLGLPYVLLEGPEIGAAPLLTPAERGVLLDAARSLDQMGASGCAWDEPAPAGQRLRPGDDYNARAAWQDVLAPHGWRQLHASGGLACWRRPGKVGPGWSATTGVRSRCGRDLLHVFSSNAAPFEPQKSYSRFAAYALLNHGGDYQAAARDLAAKGYGERQAPRKTSEPSPAASASAAGEAEWEAPVPIDQLPEPAPFPLASLPGPLAEYVEQCAWATNSPVDFVGVPLLGLAAGCIGASRSLGITRDHVQPPTLFAVVVGLPGTGKSPALEHVVEPLEAAERRYADRWRRLLADWQEEDPEVRGDKPVPRRLLVDDTTTEALMRTLHANQRGCVMVCDELSGLVAGMNQYKEGKGHDRQVYLRVWSASTIRVDRKSHDGGLPLVIPRPGLSIVGGVQPDVVESFLDDREGRRVNDGFLDRFLFSYPRDLPAVEEQWREIAPEARACWDGAAQWLLSIEQWRDSDGRLRPKVIGLAGCGRAAWVDFTRRHAAELNAEDFPDYLRGPWSKLKGYCGRLALTLHFLRLACEGGPAEGEQVDGLAVAGAAELVAYFKAHYLRVAVRMGADPRLEEAGRVLGWLQRNRDVKEFSRRDAYTVLRRSFKAPEDLDRPLGLLAQHGHVRPLECDAKAVGRKATQRFEVNPLWDRASFVSSVNSVTPEGV